MDLKTLIGDISVSTIDDVDNALRLIADKEVSRMLDLLQLCTYKYMH